MTLWRQAGWVRGAFSVVLAYAFLLQVIVAGLATDRMGAARMDPARLALAAESGVLCAQSADAPGHAPVQPHTDHSVCCALCAFNSLPPLVPVAAEPGIPIASPATSIPVIRGAAAGPGRERHEPRSSQGPPQNA